MAGSRSQVKGKANRMAGTVKRALGRVTGNRKLRAKGAMQEAKGKTQDTMGRTDRKLRGAANSF